MEIVRSRTRRGGRAGRFAASIGGSLLFAVGCGLLAPLEPLNEDTGETAGAGGAQGDSGGTDGSTAGSGGTTGGASAGGAGAAPGGSAGSSGTASGGSGDAGTGASGGTGSGGSDMTRQRSTLDTDGYDVCALAGGSVRCWGGGDYGALGDGQDREIGTTVNVPVTVSGIDDAVEVEVGWNFACAFRLGGTVRCWGAGNLGQIGDGTFHQGLDAGVLTPKTVSRLTVVTDLAAGYGHACAVVSDGTIECWGSGANGQLGDGIDYPTPSDGSPLPVLVVGIDNARRVFAGRYETCSILGGGALVCWGRAVPLSNPPRLGTSNVPVPVPGVGRVMDVAIGDDHACALRDDGSVTCWGEAAQGQLGNNEGTASPEPVDVAVIDDAVRIAAGTSHTCALRAGGTVSCWGSDAHGALGNGGSNDFALGPTPVEMFSNGVDLAAGSYRTCARTEGDHVFCWGFARFGALGDRLLDESSTPLEVEGVTP